MLKWFFVISTVFVLGTVGVVSQLDATQPKPTAVKVKKEPVTADTVYIAVNEYRHAHGVPQLSREVLLDKSAQLKCNDMRTGNYYNHTNPKTGKHGYSYIKDVGLSFNYASENLASGGFNNAKDVVKSWDSSPPHKAALLDPKYKLTGFGVCKIKLYPGATEVVEHFVEPLNEQPVVQQNSSTTDCITLYSSLHCTTR